ncbi:MAG: hypothetical protein QM489_01725 [Candidatus Izemoplasma sp.]
MPKYFGTDGIRGKAFVDLTVDMAYRVGQSLKSSLNTKTLIIGCDTRESSDELLNSVAKGAMSTGVNVINSGVVPTPLIAYISTLKSITGVMITASHNPYHDNGIKVFNKGLKLKLDEELKIEEFIDNDIELDLATEGSITTDENNVILYKELFNSIGLAKTSFNVGIDSANGANYLLAKEILGPLCNKLVQVGKNPTGTNINAKVGSTYLETIKAVVKDNKLDFGLSFDGDGDRVLLVDQDSKTIDGDELIYIIASYLKSINKLNRNTVVLTSMSNLGIIKSFERLGIKVVLTDVGDKYVLEEMIKHGYSIGGENSGHIILRDYLNTGDGLLVGAFLIKILNDTKMSFKELMADITMFPQKMVNIKTTDKSVIKQLDVLKLIVNTKARWGNNGKVLIRASGTEPLVRITLSYKDEEVLDNKMNEFIDLINKLKEE